MATQEIATILHFRGVSFESRWWNEQAEESSELEGCQNLHAIKKEELRFIPHQRITPTASHLGYSGCMLLVSRAAIGVRNRERNVPVYASNEDCRIGESDSITK